MNINTIDTLRKLNIEAVACRLGMEVTRHRTRCFNHDDHHPSLHFSTHKNIWHCFVCNIGGDGISLVMKYQNSTFVDACRWLCQTFGIDDNKTIFNNLKPTKNIKDMTLKPTTDIVTLHPSMVEKSLSSNSVFCRSLVSSGLLSHSRMQNAMEVYRLGATREGGVIFWQIDRHERVCDGKIMHYDINCHRLKEKTPTWVSWMMKHRFHSMPADTHTTKCLFGLHLLPTTANSHDVQIAIVESEKTAVICSEIITLQAIKQVCNIGAETILPDVLWMATGGVGNLSAELLMPLKDYKITLFPDTDETGTTYNLWRSKAEEIGKILGQRIWVSNILEQNATEQQKKNKIDIGDLFCS